MSTSFDKPSRISQAPPDTDPSNSQQDLSLNTSSGIASYASRIVAERLSQGYTLVQFEELLRQHQQLADEALDSQERNDMDSFAECMRQLWRATGLTPGTLGPVLREIEKRKEETQG